MKRLFAIILLLLPAAPACAFDLGDLGGLGSGNSRDGNILHRAQQALKLVDALTPISDAQEQQLGRAVAARVIARYGIENSPRRTYYLNLIGTAIAQRSDRPEIPYRFAILATDDVNAYACPGGYIFVTRGAMNMVRDEAELAAVLAHEISHVTERHIVKALQQSKLMQVGGEVAAEAFRTSGPLFDKMTGFATDALFNGLQKSDEYDSDAKAVEYLNRVGYDYPAMTDVLELLDARRKAGAAKVLAKTHPSPQTRIRQLHSASRKLALDAPTGIRLPARFDRFTHTEKTPS